MEFSNNILTFLYLDWVKVLTGFILALVITWVAIPSIVSVAKLKGLYVKPEGRSSHTSSTPLLGGVAVFAGLIISTVVIAWFGNVQEMKFIIAGLIILFFIGLRDDIQIIDTRKKFVVQIIASLIIIVLGNIRIGNFNGIWGINEIPYLVSIILTLFVFLLLINGFNLIDGIDGLASGVGIITSLTFGVLFWLSGHIPYAVLCISLAGSLIAFFRFNVFSKTNKIFLGDTGSLIIGLTMAVVCIRFIQFEPFAIDKANVTTAPAVALGILIIPLFDTLRVFTIRILKGGSPFKGDKNHIHHILLDLGYSHLKATMIILSVNLIIIVLVLLLQDFGLFNLFLIEMLVPMVLLSIIPVYMVRRKNKMLEA